MCTQVCILCKTERPLEDYYKHPLMRLGVDSKCKQCVKEKAKERHHKLFGTDSENLEKERERHREKYRRLEYKEQQKQWDKDKPWKKLSVYKGLRKNHYKDLPKEFELHHWNYNEEYLLDVFILSIRDHKKLHQSLFLDLEKRVFYLKDGTYLDTREKHSEYIEEIINKNDKKNSRK